MTALSTDDLYGLPLDRFIPERATLVKALKADGERDDAAAVAALRKPSIAAWAVNQLIRTLTEAAAGLLDSSGNALSPTTVKQVTDTLRAAALDERARARRAESRRRDSRRAQCG